VPGIPNLWRRDVEAGDIAAYRHYHPPLFIYLLHAAEQLAGYSDVAVRLVPLAFALATIATAYLGCALLIPVRGAQIGLVAAAILAVLPLHVATAADIGWHVPIRVCSHGLAVCNGLPRHPAYASRVGPRQP
jgi:4-amino-4-deoxy-L-arabinose transferase-like glycosyltransferase